MNKLIIPGVVIGAASIAIAISTGIASSLTSRLTALAASGIHKANNHSDYDKSGSDNLKPNK